MPVKVVVPQLGESVYEGTVVKWFKDEGQEIGRDEPVVEIMTDKINIEIPSPAAGKIGKLLAKEGDVVKVNQLLAVILKPSESPSDLESFLAEAPASAPAKGEAPISSITQSVSGDGDRRDEKTREPLKEEIPVEQQLLTQPLTPPTAWSPSQRPASQTSATQSQTSPQGAVPSRLSPAVRRLARENNLDLSMIKGTGRHGRISKRDVEMFIASGVTRTVGAPAPQRELVVEEVKLLGRRKAIAKAMQRSHREVAEVTTFTDVDMSRISEIRAKYKDMVKEKWGVNLTFMPFIIKAAVETLKEYPYVNASLDEERIYLKKFYNVGVAVDTDDGLIVPNVKSADTKTIVQIAVEITDLAERARTNKLTLTDVQQGTFSITNAGGYGALLSTPIINYPEVAILGVHAIKKRPVVRDGQIVVRDMMYLALTFDHRIMDGVYAVRFLEAVKKRLEEPELLLLS